jgi:Ricin-type beta-trefoil lectin domain-like
MNFFRIVNVFNEKAITPPNWSREVGKGIIQFDDNGTKDHLWAFVTVKMGYFKIVNFFNDLWIGVDANDNVIQGSEASDRYYWYLQEEGKHVRLFNKATGKVLTPRGWSKENGSEIIVWDDNGNFHTDDHLWKLIPSHKRYNEVTSVMAHDSHTAVRFYGDNEKIPVYSTQTEPIDQQLRGGVRTVRISSGTRAIPNEMPAAMHQAKALLSTINVGHEVRGFNPLDPNDWKEAAEKVGDVVTNAKDKVEGAFNEAKEWFTQIPDHLKEAVSKDYEDVILMHTFAIQYLRNYLMPIKQFLDQNPNEIITIIDEGGGDSNIRKGCPRETYQEQLAQVYADVFGGNPQQPGGKNGGVHLFFPTNDANWSSANDLANGKWPEVEAMVRKNQRLVVFMTGSLPVATPVYRQKYPWLLNAWGQNDVACMASSYYDYEGSYETRPISFDPRASCGVISPKSLYLMQHFFYDKSWKMPLASRTYAKWTVGDLLIEDTLRAWVTTKVRPNFLNVDFYQGVWKAKSYVKQLADWMNQVDNPLDLFKLVHQSGIQIEDSSASRCLILGKTYQIISLDNQQFCVGINASNELEMQRIDNSLGQKWTIFYNTPHVGVTFVNAHRKLQWVYNPGNQYHPVRLQSYCPIFRNDLGEVRPGNQYEDTAFEITSYSGNRNFYVIRRSHDIKMNLDVQGGRANQGVKVGMFAWTKNNNQIWVLKEA